MSACITFTIDLRFLFGAIFLRFNCFISIFKDKASAFSACRRCFTWITKQVRNILLTLRSNIKHHQLLNTEVICTATEFNFNFAFFPSLFIVLFRQSIYFLFCFIHINRPGIFTGTNIAHNFSEGFRAHHAPGVNRLKKFPSLKFCFIRSIIEPIL